MSSDRTGGLPGPAPEALVPVLLEFLKS